VRNIDCFVAHGYFVWKRTADSSFIPSSLLDNRPAVLGKPPAFLGKPPAILGKPPAILGNVPVSERPLLLQPVDFTYATLSGGVRSIWSTHQCIPLRSDFSKILVWNEGKMMAVDANKWANTRCRRSEIKWLLTSLRDVRYDYFIPSPDHRVLIIVKVDRTTLVRLEGETVIESGPIFHGPFHCAAFDTLSIIPNSVVYFSTDGSDIMRTQLPSLIPEIVTCMCQQLGTVLIPDLWRIVAEYFRSDQVLIQRVASLRKGYVDAMVCTPSGHLIIAHRHRDTLYYLDPRRTGSSSYQPSVCRLTAPSFDSCEPHPSHYTNRSPSSFQLILDSQQTCLYRFNSTRNAILRVQLPPLFFQPPTHLDSS
jgi:hypothetical protein